MRGSGVRSSNANALLIAAGALTVLAAVCIAWPPVNGEIHARATGTAGHQMAAPAESRAPVAAPEAMAGDALANIGMALSATPEAANDVVFLTAAAAYGRCEPAHAHEFGVMAARARLPVLAGLTSVLSPASGSRATLLAGIRELAGRLPCDGPVILAIGPFRQRVDIHAYAAAFPDSYFEPDLPSASAEFAGRSLADRANDSCNGVAYTVLPLDAPRAWQCTALRAETRRRITALCGGTADAAAQQIHDAVTRLPSTCQ
jgi:hypothetical protein